MSVKAKAPSQRLPDLRIVAIERLRLHETLDGHRLGPMIEALQRDERLRNPPIVAALPGTSDFVVLDGANRITGLTRMGYPHALVQVVDYEDSAVELGAWYHVVCHIDRHCFTDLLANIAGLCTTDADLFAARAALARREVMAYLVYPGGDVELLQGGASLGERITLLNALVDTYRGKARIYRTDTDLLDQVLPFYDEVTAIVVFPHYRPVEIMALAREGRFLPTGITRHVIAGRALHVNLPLSDLADLTRSLEEKNRWLQKWIKERLAGHGVRFYQESTFLFDE
jgi:hypothetical protein